MHSEDYSAVAETQDVYAYFQDVYAYFFVLFEMKKHFVCRGDVEGATYLLNVIM